MEANQKRLASQGKAFSFCLGNFMLKLVAHRAPAFFYDPYVTSQQ
jgi:hypothetical protein